MTDEQDFLQTRLLQAGVALALGQVITAQNLGTVQAMCIHTGLSHELDCATLILVTGRVPNDAFYHALAGHPKVASLARIGDCLQPSSIADAVYSAHRFARGFGAADSDLPLNRERPPVSGSA
jgi:dimethylamine/trimethylamine dehydrogenase